MALSDKGIQIILATHSLFLMKEIDYLQKTKKAVARYITLDKEGDNVVASWTDEMEDLPNITSLQTEFDQSDRYFFSLKEGLCQ